MYSQLLLLSSLACLASAAAIGPWHHEPWAQPYRDYVGGIKRVLAATSTFTCVTPANSAMPSSTLPPPSQGLTVYHVALGRGLQNYTCPPDAGSSDVPIALGAVANLYNTTCMASVPIPGGNPPYVLNNAPAVAVANSNPNASDSKPIHPLGSGSVISGHHYFTDSTTPTFNLVWDTTNYGIFFSKKTSNVTAPATAAIGPDGSKAVPWLKLEVESPVAPLTIEQKDLVPSVKEIYRVNTAGGAAPATCAGMPTAFSRQYAAEYWFFA